MLILRIAATAQINNSRSLNEFRRVLICTASIYLCKDVVSVKSIVC